jgi:homocysteine S-methyltransferase
MSDKEAEDYHRAQIETFAGTAADLVTAMTINYAEEAVGLARAAEQANMPVVLSFTVETDGRLSTGQSLGDAIEQVDDATSGYPAYFMINCAHPSHFDRVVEGDEPWVERIRGLPGGGLTTARSGAPRRARHPGAWALAPFATPLAVTG